VPSLRRIWNPRERERPYRNPDQEISEQRWQVQRAKKHDYDHRARQQYQNQFERPAHLEVLVLLG
jgi:hypothetical protein